MASPSTRVLAWQAAWESRNPDKVAALYSREATHASAVVTQLYPEAKASVLKGRDQIREYARRGMEMFTTLRFEILSHQKCQLAHAAGLGSDPGPGRGPVRRHVRVLVRALRMAFGADGCRASALP